MAQVWYVSGGMWPSAKQRNGREHTVSAVLRTRDGSLQWASAPAQDDDRYRGIITKTTDAGKTWSVVFNDTGFNATKFYYFNGIDCASETECWAVAECPDEASCPGMYGFWILHTADGGKTWEEQAFNYEQSSLSVQVLSASDVWVAAGPVGALDINGFVYHSTDGGRSWDQHKLPAMGMIMDLSMLGGAGGGYATACDPAASRCGVWKYVV